VDGVEGRGSISEGVLACVRNCGRYPVLNGVPVLLPERCQQNYELAELQASTRDRFSAEWSMYRYGDTTWGVTVNERVPVVLHELGWSREDLANKVILDAGCGNGTLSHALAELGATVVAMDLSSGVFRGQRHCPHERLHFVQGNIFFPPLQDDSFDAIYSCGVFHHTPDTRRCFDALVPTLKGGEESRYFVWLYSARSPLFNCTVEQAMKLTRRLPPKVAVPSCYALAPLVEAASRAVTALGIAEYGARSLRDRAIQNHDLLTPTFVRYHEFAETRQWAREAGFEQIHQTDYNPADNGLAPDVRKLLDKYRSICRPGFGCLCKGLGVAVS
jgi:SAM-dependent methyltransferase